MQNSDDALSPLALYETLKDSCAAFRFDGGDLIIVAACGLIDEFDDQIQKNVGALSAIIREFEPCADTTALEAASEIVTQAERILSEVESHGGEGNGRKGPR